MRVSLATAACVVFAALLAGCSTSSQGTSAVPNSFGAPSGASDFMRGGNHQGVNPFAGIHGKLTLEKIYKLQLQGKLHRVASREVLEAQIKVLQQHKRPRLRFNPDHTPAIWATNPNYGYLVGLNKAGTKALTAADTNSVGCYYPYTVKVDHGGNAWTSCEDNASFNGGAVAEFSSSGAPEGTYSWTPCTPSSTECYGYGYDVAANASNVFGAVEYYFEETCVSSCSYSYGAGYYWWPNGSPSAGGTFVNLYGYGMYDVYNMDLDSSGNLWVDGYGCYGSWCGVGIAEVTNPASPSAAFNWIISEPELSSLGSECPEGLYVRAGGTLVVTDECTRVLYEFSLPSGTPAGSLGPTATNFFGAGGPYSGGFNWNDTKIVQGDTYGWVDLGAVNTNHWNLKANPNLNGYVPGAAYDPSDK